MKLRFRGRTDVGKTRDHNEDDYGYGEGAEVEHFGDLLVVCDGMGGHAAGEVASHLGVETIIAAYYEDASEDRRAALLRAFELANARIHAEGRGSMGTTGVAALLHQGAAHLANVGDSRAYLLRGGELRQVTRDHSLVGEQMAAGVITAEQARSLYYRNVITRALGYQSEVTVDLFQLSLQPGDALVLCSDGLHGLVEDDEIARIVAGAPLDDAVEQLVDLANERGGSDNITVLVALVDALDAPAAGLSDDHERDTLELAPEAVAEMLDAPAAPAPAALPEAPAAAAPAARPQPRRLSPAGLILSALLLLALGGAIILLRPAPVEAPAPAATAVQATAAATATPSPAASPTATRAAATATPSSTP